MAKSTFQKTTKWRGFDIPQPDLIPFVILAPDLPAAPRMLRRPPFCRPEADRLRSGRDNGTENANPDGSVPLMSHAKSTPDVIDLLGLFYNEPTDAGTLEAIPADLVPPPFHGLLVHDEHMTVTVEAFHGGPVDVRVLEVKKNEHWYARKILLARKSDGRIVQFGIVRLDPLVLPVPVWERIESQQTPLGRVLIEHQVLREVQLVGTFKVQVGPDLAKLMDVPPQSALYGRTAMIFVHDRPAVELLEIVNP